MCRRSQDIDAVLANLLSPEAYPYPRLAAQSAGDT
jgi:hypothetical protein